MTAPKRTPRTAKFEVMQGDYAHRLEDLADRAFAAREKEKNTRQRAGAKSESMRLAAEHDALAEEARETAIVLTLEAPRRSVVAKLRDEHSEKDDKGALIVDQDTFAEAIVPLAVKEPEFTSEELAEFLETLSVGEWQELYQTVLGLCAGIDDLPKSSLVSRLQDLSRQESKSRDDSEQGPRQRLTTGPTRTTAKPSPTSS